MMNSKDILAVVRKYWDTAPVDVFAILRELGLGPAQRALPANISGMIERRDGDGFLVVLNNTQSMTRQRFTAAHELGHYIYHRDLLGKGVGDTLAYRAEGTELPNEHIRVTHERQANNFRGQSFDANPFNRQVESRRDYPALRVGEPARRI